jgi:hypothetical protein
MKIRLEDLIGVLFGICFGMLGAAVLYWWIDKRDGDSNGM